MSWNPRSRESLRLHLVSDVPVGALFERRGSIRAYSLRLLVKRIGVKGPFNLYRWAAAPTIR